MCIKYISPTYITFMHMFSIAADPAQEPRLAECGALSGHTDRTRQVRGGCGGGGGDGGHFDGGGGGVP